MTAEEYKRLVTLTLQLRQAESLLASVEDKVKEANELLRQMVMRKGEPNGR